MKHSSLSTQSLFLVVSCFFSASPQGFVRGTLVKTPAGYRCIENIRVGDEVIAFDGVHGQYVANKVAKVVVCLQSDIVCVAVQDEAIATDRHQIFYDTHQNEWRSFEVQTRLNGNSGQVHEDYDCPSGRFMLLFDLVVEPAHTFCVTLHDIVVHNFVETAVASVSLLSVSTCVSGIAASALVPLVVPAAAGATLLWIIGKKIVGHWREKQKEKSLVESCPYVEQRVSTGTPQEPEDPEDNKQEKTIEDIVSKMSFLEKMKPKRMWTVLEKSEVSNIFPDLPHVIRENVKRAVGKTSGKFSNYTIKEFFCGTYLLEMTKPGNVPGSKAIYYKVILQTGKTWTVFKDTFDHLGRFVHRKIKW